MILNSQLHTIYLLIGPTECGKTTFAKEVLIPQLRFADESRNFISNVQYLSSDEIRQQLLGYEYDKYDTVMMEASSQAFQMLFSRLKAAVSFPINADFVVVDTTGLTEDFREQVTAIAAENAYHVDVILFDYKHMSDYYASERSKKLITQHVTRLRRDVLPNLRRKDFTNIHKVKAKDFYDTRTATANPNYVVEIENKADYLNSILPGQYRYTIIGDLHEKIDELKALLTASGFPIENDLILETDQNREQRIVLLGDFVDKGFRTKETVEFIHKNLRWFYLVKGNHENFVEKFLRGQIHAHTVDPELIEEQFTSISALENDPELCEKFLHLVDVSNEYYRYVGLKSPSYYLTHAPCLNKYIGKLDPQSRKKQRRFPTIHGEPMEEQLAFLQEEATGNHPFHVFGHVMAKEPFRIKNKLGIDTGIVVGNVLTSIVIESGKPYFKTQKPLSPEDDRQELPKLFQKRAQDVQVDELSEADQRRLHYVLKNKINFISGTMSPADKDEAAGELEALEKGLAHFASNGVSEVVLQPKYMGSRCNIYLHTAVENCYAVSRNGYKIDHVELTPVYERLLERHQEWMQARGISMMLLDGELLPWHTLGKGLIEKEFQVVANALEQEIHFLKETGFDAHFGQLRANYEVSEFEKIHTKLSKKDLIEKFGETQYSTFKHLYEALPSYYPTGQHEVAFQTYKEQLDLFGHAGEVEYKPFSILKLVKEDGSEELPKMKTSEMFALLSDDEIVVLDLKDPSSLELAKRYYEKLTTDQKMEGVVIKPEFDRPGAAPYLKVRNPLYLTLIYGYDYSFPHKYRKLIRQKNIAKKLRTSIAEYKLGKRMLSFPLDSIQPGNREYKQVVANLLFETSNEKTIDPRL